MKWWRSVLARFGHTPAPSPESEALRKDAEKVIRELRQSEIIIKVVPKNQRALAELRRLEGNARR